MFWKDTEWLVLVAVLEELWKLREDPNAIVRVLRYAVERLGLPVQIVKSEKFIAPLVERCEEIEPVEYLG